MASTPSIKALIERFAQSTLSFLASLPASECFFYFSLLLSPCLTLTGCGEHLICDYNPEADFIFRIIPLLHDQKRDTGLNPPASPIDALTPTPSVTDLKHTSPKWSPRGNASHTGRELIQILHGEHIIRMRATLES